MTDSSLEAMDYVCGYVCFLTVTPGVRQTTLHPLAALDLDKLHSLEKPERTVSPWRNGE